MVSRTIDDCDFSSFNVIINMDKGEGEGERKRNRKVARLDGV